MTDIHSHLKALRRARELTQEAVARQMGLTRQAVSSHESGRTQPDLETLERIAAAMGVAVTEVIYGAAAVTYTTLADKKVKQIESLGISHYPICIAKTQYSFSSDPKAYGVAKDFELKVRDIVINNGAEMIVVIMGEIMRMPGLPKEPQALKIDIVNGQIEGLS